MPPLPCKANKYDFVVNNTQEKRQIKKIRHDLKKKCTMIIKYDNNYK